jgi:hypothetical protein
MVEPDFQPLHGLARQVGNPPLPFRIGLAPANQRLAGAVRPELNVAYLERHEFCAPGERFVSHAEQCALAIRSEPLARAPDKFLDLLPAQGARLRLPSGRLPADSLLRQGERPTVEKIRAAIGSGSPNTVGPLLDVWWKHLAARLDSGPAALHSVPETVAHVAEALWLQALEEGRRRAQLELKSTKTAAAEQQQTLEVRSHVLTLREGELDDRLNDRERTINELNLQLREFTLLLRKEQATREAKGRRIATLEEELLARQRPRQTLRRPQVPAKPQRTSTRKPRKKPTRKPSSRKPRR